MQNSDIATAIALRDLNCYTLKSIDDRILLQKKIYLAQDIGLPLNYGYSWHINGPYSADLTSVAYQIIPEGDKAIEGKKFREPYDSIIRRINSLENCLTANQLKLSVVQWYDLITSIAYWYNRGYNSKEKVLEKIRTIKPQFTEDQVYAAFLAYITL